MKLGYCSNIEKLVGTLFFVWTVNSAHWFHLVSTRTLIGQFDMRQSSVLFETYDVI